MVDKSEIRQKALARRAVLDRGQKATFEAALCAHIAAAPLFQDAARVALYVPVRGEVDVQTLWGSGKTFVFPRIESDGLVFCPAEGPDDLAPGLFGIPAPKRLNPVGLESLDLIIVPGLVFDRQGYRLGYGKGFYDRILQAVPAVQTIGVCLDEFFVPALPRDAWDVRVKYVATQTGIYKTER